MLDSAPIRERIASWGEALRIVPEPECEAISVRLFEAAASARAPLRDGALGPAELVLRWPERLRVRHAEAAMFQLMGGWDRVPGSVRPLASGLARDRWLRVAHRAAASPDTVFRRAAACFAEDTADPGLAGMVCALLADEHQSVRLRADRALLRMAMTLLTHIPDPLLGEEFGAITARPVVTMNADPEVLGLERVELCRQIANAAWSFSEHRCRAPLVASLLILDRVPGGSLERSAAARIRRLLNEAGHPSHSPVRTVLRRTPSPLLRERALRWIVIDPIRPTCVERLSQADSPEEHEITLRRATLAMRAARGTRLRGVRPGADGARSPVPCAATMATLSADARRGAVRFVQLIGLDDDARRRLLEPTLADPDPLVRLAGAHAAHPADLCDYAYDPDAGVAASAAVRWSTLGLAAPVPGSSVWTHRRIAAALLARSPHVLVRETARAELDRLDMFAGTPAGRVTARRQFERDPVGFVRQTRAALEDPAAVLPALMLVRALGLSSRFEMDLVDLATTAPDDRARATAVAALGTLPGETARRIVRASLHAPDQRVRSNAVEAVTDPDSTLLEFKDDPGHRVRASAVRRLLGEGRHPGDLGGHSGVRESAAESLARMIADDRAEHRLSGAWAAERVLLPERRAAFGPAWRSVVRRVVDAAAHDTDERVRLRAGRCLRRIETAHAGSGAA